MINTNDIQALVAFAILNNRTGVIQAMNSTGNAVAANISDTDLAVALWNVFAAQGVTGLKNVLARVPVDPTQISEEEAKALMVKFNNVNPNAKFGDWIKGVGDYFGDLLGGSSVTGGTVQNMTSESVLSPTIIALIVVAGLILIGIFRKSVAVVVAIVVLILAVVLYGIFAKKITTTLTGGGTVSHGGLGSVILTWLTGKP